MDAVRSGIEQFGAASPPVIGTLADICGEVAAAFKQAWGRGPARISARWAAGGEKAAAGRGRGGPHVDRAAGDIGAGDRLPV
jgi:hypothetical protein